MGATITDGTTTITPALVLGYESTQSSRNVVHAIIGRPDPDVSLAPAALRKGTLNLFFLSAEDAQSAALFHAQAARFTYSDSDLPSAGMTYVLDDGGSMEFVYDTDTGIRATLAVPFQEVKP